MNFQTKEVKGPTTNLPLTAEPPECRGERAGQHTQRRLDPPRERRRRRWGDPHLCRDRRRSPRPRSASRVRKPSPVCAALSKELRRRVSETGRPLAALRRASVDVVKVARVCGFASFGRRSLKSAWCVSIQQARATAATAHFVSAERAKAPSPSARPAWRAQWGR